MIVVVPGFLTLLIYGSFVQISLAEEKFFTLNLSLLIILGMFLLQSIFAILNNNWRIPKFK